ncbi:MAG: putative beta-lysine N-acetyltransferase [Kiritimatiellae bacterium]|nr:putative beta-lysine N-acetyltransferase [Kiritimatiellia bacterium]
MTTPALTPDTIEKLGGSLIQHGPANQRIYLMKLDQTDLPDLPKTLIDFAQARAYGKIFAVVPEEATPSFAVLNYQVEARIPGYFHGESAADLLACYLTPERAQRDETETLSILKTAQKKAADQTPPPPLPEGAKLRAATPDDTPEMARLYRRVFETYPFPIHDSDYLLQTMKDHILYYGVWRDDRLLALSSAETRPENRSVEMTDFATDPDARGAALARHLLAHMDHELPAAGFRTAYTIARAASHGMNITFARAGYNFGGTLWNNTQICGRLEHMNVWHKPL